MPKSPQFQDRLREGAAILGLDLNHMQIMQLLGILQLLVQWNHSYNLTAVRDPMAMVGYHLLDSLALLPYLTTGPVLDLGTGAGFPGLPLAIMHPELSFTLLDSNGKKTRFVRQVIIELGLNNVNVVQSRIEAYKNPLGFATITARALAPLQQLLLWAEPLLTRPGVLLAPKGQQILAELSAIPKARYSHLLQHKLAIPYVDGLRTLVEIRV